MRPQSGSSLRTEGRTTSGIIGGGVFFGLLWKSIQNISAIRAVKRDVRFLEIETRLLKQFGQCRGEKRRQGQNRTRRGLC